MIRHHDSLNSRAAIGGLLACMALLTCVGTIRLYAQASGTAMITDDRVRLRDGPSLQGATLLFLGKGEAVDVLDSGSRDTVGDVTAYWRKVRTSSGKTGWVFGAFLKSTDPADSPLFRWAVPGIDPEGATGSRYLGVAIDTVGSSYVVGSITGTGPYQMGALVKLVGSSEGENALLVKYDVTGTAVWGRAASGTGDESRFEAVATDLEGNVYAAGYISGNDSLNLGNGMRVAGLGTQKTAVIAKFGSSGLALWARAVSSGSGNTHYYAVAADTQGNVYAAGTSTGGGDFGFGGKVTVKGSAGKDAQNVLLVKYDKSGAVAWARSLTAGSLGAGFDAVAVDVEGNVIAAGSVLSGAQKYGFGNGVTVIGAQGERENPLLVKYAPDGKVIWAKEGSAGSGRANLGGLAVDGKGAITVVGSFSGTDTLTLGAGVSAGGANGEGDIPYIARFTGDGKAIWARSPIGAAKCSVTGVAVDGGGTVYVVGQTTGTTIWAQGMYDDDVSTRTELNMPFILKLVPDGGPQWAELGQMVNPVAPMENGSFDFVALGANASLRVVGKTTDGSKDWGVLEAY
jgi:hypothetical protein